jgi:hypothetical protein
VEFSLILVRMAFSKAAGEAEMVEMAPRLDEFFRCWMVVWRFHKVDD